MARFKTILTNQGAAALTLAMFRGEKIYPDFVLMGQGIFADPPQEITELVDPVNVDARVMDREFIEPTAEQPAILQISVQTFNTGITVPTPIREILLYANSNGGEDMANAIPFAYAWLDGPDTDNVLPPPLVPGVHDTIHLHELALFVTNQEVASIEVSFAFNGFVTHRYLNEILDGIGSGAVELSDTDTPQAGTKAHLFITDSAPEYENESTLFSDAKITEMRIQKDPKNPTTSPFNAALPITITRAVFDAETGKTLEQMLKAISEGATPNTVIKTIPISENERFSIWELYEAKGGIYPPLETWGFTNATLEKIPSRVEVDLNTNTARLFSVSTFAGREWDISEYEEGTFILSAAELSLILIRR